MRRRGHGPKLDDTRFRPPVSRWGDRRARSIGLLGGSYNPGHEGHRHIAAMALGRLGLDEVWLLVSPQNPLKSRDGMAPLAGRLASARRVAGDDPRIRPMDLEERLGTRYTAHTLSTLARRFPRARFVWLMGADNLEQMEQWWRWPAIFARVPVAIFARGPYSARALAAKAAQRFAFARTGARGLAGKRPPAWTFLHIRRHPASSTAIRAAQPRQEP